MRLDAEDIAEIREAIRDEGMPCLWETTVRVPVDEDKPWLGDEVTSADTPVVIAFVNVATAAALLTAWGKDSDVPGSSFYGLMPNVAFAPAVGQRVKRTGKEDLIVKDITAAEPAGVALFYLLEFIA